MPARKPCVDCGEPKGPSRMLYCEPCAAKHEHSLCLQCKQPMPKGRGRGKKLCDDCQPIRPLPGQYTPCRMCGSTARKLFGRNLCDDCAEISHEVATIRRHTRKIPDRKPCRRCGKTKRRGQGVRYCDACSAELKAPRTCPRCERNPITVHQAQMCEPCRIEARERVKAKKRKWSREHSNRDRGKPRKRKRDSAFEWRLKQERNGVKLEAVASVPGHDPFPRLPARPLAAAIQLMVDREDRMLSLFDPCLRTTGTSMGGICDRLGIKQRTYTGWRSGERMLVDFDHVDMVLTKAGWLWWEVYSEASCRRPILTVAVRELRSNGPRKPAAWMTVRRSFYGDWGTVPRLDGEGYEDGVDRAALALVEGAFTGESVEVPAEPVLVPMVEEYRGQAVPAKPRVKPTPVFTPQLRDEAGHWLPREAVAA